MRPRLNSEQALNVLFNWTYKLLDIVRWLIFVTFHLVLVVLCLALLWMFQISPRDVSEWVRLALRTETAQGAAAVIGFAGLSGLALLMGYVRLWRRVFSSITAKYLMRGLEP